MMISDSGLLFLGHPVCPNDLLDGDLCKISFISIFYLFWFVNMILTCVDFTSIAASNTANDVTN